jgi:hypothetical protein
MEKPVMFIDRISIVKMAIILKAIYRFNVILIKTPMTFFTEIEKNNSKILRETQIPQIAKAILSRERIISRYRDRQ